MRHYYQLAGESLNALNKLIEYDRHMTDFRMTDVRKKLAELFGKTGPEEDPAKLQSTLSTHFSSAQVRTYKEKLGFDAPPVQVHSLAGGLLYRAYDVYPKIAMNPGTSKANFGVGDLFRGGNTLDPNGERIAIYTSYEDYKGNHFAPPGAVKISEEEFASYDAYKDVFEYYRTYDEGTEVPADFDPAKHHAIVQEGYDSHFNFKQAFLVTGESADKLREYTAHRNNWFMPYQDFRDKLMPPLLQQLTYVRLNSWIQNPSAEIPKRTVRFDLGIDEWNAAKDGLDKALQLEKFEARPKDGCRVTLSAKEDTPIGKQIADAMATVSLEQNKSPVDFGFDERPSLENHAELHKLGDTGFPYMKIERYEDGDVKLFVMRLPPNVTKVETPESCSPVSIDDYRAIAATEENLPTHVFRVEGEAYKLLAQYDNDLKAHLTKLQAFEEKVKDLFRSVAPACEFDEFRLRSYKTVGDTPRTLSIHVREKDYEAAKGILEDHFKMDYVSRGNGYRQDWVNVHMIESDHSDNAKAMLQTINEVGYEPSYTKALDKYFEFCNQGGYDQMVIKHLDRLNLHAVIYNLPSFVTGVEPPKDCIPLTKEEYTLLFAEMADLSRGSPLPPRPAHLRHLPETEGMKKSREGVNELKKSKDRDGLPLHERTEFSWFQIR